MTKPESEFGFHERRSLAAKVGRTFLLAIVGVFFGLFTCVVFAVKANPPWLILAKLAIEVCWTFWVLALLYVWFDVKWLRSIYLHSERRLLALAKIAIWILPLITLAALGLILYLKRAGLLP